ncbi:MAG: hypothetical protein V1493_00240 [Candidatus Diapherotrites archaeon]
MVERPTGVTVAGILLIILGIFSLLIMIGVFWYVFSMASGSVPPESLLTAEGSADYTAVESSGAMMLVYVFAAIFALLVVLEILAGFFILKGKNWAKWVGAIFAVIQLIGFPVGTIIGILIIYFLLVDKSGKAYFEAAKTAKPV